MISFSKYQLQAAALATVVSAHAQTDKRLPIIARVEVRYSMVSHQSHLSERVNFYNTWGDPRDNRYHAVPHLVYEPIVTLYNPYNTKLVLPKSRVRIANPPVGFKFKKNDDYLRPEWNSGGPFLGLGRFQSANESNPNVEKYFTLLLAQGSGIYGQPDEGFTLSAGESMNFWCWVEKNWTWGLETSGGGARAFFDFDVARDLTNNDGRFNNLLGTLAGGFRGHPSIPYAGADFRAGFQTDCLSVGTGRPAATRYPFETGTFGTTGWVSTKLTDFVRVEAKGVDTVQNPAVPDFQVSLMGDNIQIPATSTFKSYSFTIDDLAQPPTPDAGTPSISRVFKVSDILQTPADSSAGGKTPFASFVLVARSSALQRKRFQEAIQPPANELYEARLQELFNFTPSLATFGPSDFPKDGVVVTGVERIGDSLMLDIAAPPFVGSLPFGKIMGGGNLDAPLTDDLTSQTRIQLGPEGTGIYKLTVPVPAGSERYFVQIGY